MKKSVLCVIAIGFAILGSGCGGGSNSPVSELSQVDKANRFVTGLNAMSYVTSNYVMDSYGNWILVQTVQVGSTGQYAVAKGVSQQPGYAVIMDTRANTYYAISMNDFYKIGSPGATHYDNTDPRDYEKAMTVNGMTFYNLRYNAGSASFTQILFDGSEGLTFNARQMDASEINVAKARAQAYSAKVSVIRSNLQKLGMTASKASEASALIVAAQTTNGSTELTKPQINEVMKSVTGLTLNDAVSAAQGSAMDQARALAKAVKSGAISDPEQGVELVTRVMSELGL